jgi:GNAT superfamily N-acetyltransferase
MQIQLLADRPDLVPAIARWYFEEWGHKEPDNSVEATIERLSGKLNCDIFPIPIVATDADGSLLGTVQLKVREMEIFPDREFWLGGVYVASQARGRGIGAELVKRIAELAEIHKISELWLQTHALDGGLYARLGWSTVEKLTYKGEEIAVMVRRFGI